MLENILPVRLVTNRRCVRETERVDEGLIEEQRDASAKPHP